MSLTITSVKPAPIIAAFHNDFMAKLESGRHARVSMRTALTTLLTSRSKAMPTDDTWRNDRAALTQLAKDKGLSDFTDYHLMEYTIAVRTLYGATPVNMSIEAKRKRAERIAAISPDATKAYAKAYADALAADQPDYVAEALGHAAGVKVKGKRVKADAGAPAHVPQEHAVKRPENIEQLLATFGLFETLEAIARIVAADKSTETQGLTLNAVANQLRVTGQRNDATAAAARQSARKAA
jgi:hypothetical protein